MRVLRKYIKEVVSTRLRDLVVVVLPTKQRTRNVANIQLLLTSSFANIQRLRTN